MIMLVMFSPALEAEVGAWAYLGSFVATGIFGWLGTLLDLKLTHGDGDMWEFAAKYQTSCGSSPALGST